MPTLHPTHDRGALTKLDISSNQICPYVGDGTESRIMDGMNAIAGMLKTSTSIAELKFSNNNIDAEAAKILVRDMQDKDITLTF